MALANLDDADAEDEVRLRHLVAAANKAVSYAAGRSHIDLDQDELLRLALTKRSPPMCCAVPELSIDGLRPKLSHRSAFYAAAA